MDMNLVLQEMKLKRRGSDYLKEGALEKHLRNEENKGKAVNNEKSEEPVFVESSVQRKGSRVYKNSGWKYSRTNSGRSGSLSSFRSIGRHSSSEESTDAKNPHRNNLGDLPCSPCMPKLSKEEMSDFLEKKFDEIFDILKCAGVDVNM